MKNIRSIFTIFAILFVVLSAQTSTFSQEVSPFSKMKKGNLAMAKGKTRVYIPQNQADSSMIVDFIRSNTELEIVSERTKADFMLSLSTGANTYRYFHPTQRQTPLATITNSIEGPMLDQPQPPQSLVISTRTSLTIWMRESADNVVLWQRSEVTPVAPSTYVPNLSDSPFLRLKDPSSYDKVKLKLLQMFVEDFAKVK